MDAVVHVVKVVKKVGEGGVVKEVGDVRVSGCNMQVLAVHLYNYVSVS